MMKNRVFFLLIILFFRFILGLVELGKYQDLTRIKVSGNIDNIYRKNSECIIQLGRFWINYRKQCYFSRMDKVEVVGRIQSSVIDRFLGRLWLDSAELVFLNVPNNSGKSTAVFSKFFDNLRENLVAKYIKYLPVPESGLVAGIVLGYQKDIGQEMYRMMVTSGTIHIAVASGYNVMLLGGTVMALCFWFVRRKWASLVSVGMMVVYALLAGGEPPVIRAVIMATAVFGAAVLGRKSISWWILLLTGWVMVLIEPLAIVDVSFQLSMAASVGLMIFEPWLRQLIEKRDTKLGQYLGESGVLSSLATMIMTMPIIWWHFGRVSWIGILSNILILPLVPVLMITGGLMQIMPWIFSWPSFVIAHWMVKVIAFFGS